MARREEAGGPTRMKGVEHRRRRPPGHRATSFYQCVTCTGSTRTRPIRSARRPGTAASRSTGGRHIRRWTTRPRTAVFQLQQERPVCATGSSTGATSWRTTRHPLPGPRLPHDIAFTENYVILNDFCCSGTRDARHDAPAAVLSGRPSRFAVLRRRGSTGEIRWFEQTRRSCCTSSTPTRMATRSCWTAFRRRSTAAGHRRNQVGELFRFWRWIACSPRLHRWRFNLVTGAVKSNCVTPSPSSGPSRRLFDK